jgi:hypothetical protein
MKSELNQKNINGLNLANRVGFYYFLIGIMRVKPSNINKCP